MDTSRQMLVKEENAGLHAYMLAGFCCLLMIVCVLGAGFCYVCVLGAGFCYVGSALFRSRLLLYSAGTATNVHTHIIMFLEMVMKMPIPNGSGFEKNRFIYMKMELSTWKWF